MMCYDTDRWFVIGQAFGTNWACGNNTTIFSRSSAFTEFIDGTRARVEGMLFLQVLFEREKYTLMI